MKVDIEEVASPVNCWWCEGVRPSFPGQVLPTCNKHLGKTPVLNNDLEVDEFVRQGFDSINRPKHYTDHPSGIECIQITEHMNFCLGNVVKYIWRASLKNGLEDLKKAQWYINREIERLEKED